MSNEKRTELTDNTDFNKWLEDNYPVEIEEYEFPSSDVLFQMSYEGYLEALVRYEKDLLSSHNFSNQPVLCSL